MEVAALVALGVAPNAVAPSDCGAALPVAAVIPRPAPGTLAEGLGVAGAAVSLPPHAPNTAAKTMTAVAAGGFFRRAS